MRADNFLKWSYGPEFDILFIHRIESYEYEESIEMTCDVIMDFDTLNPSAFEFLNASRYLKRIMVASAILIKSKSMFPLMKT